MISIDEAIARSKRREQAARDMRFVMGIKEGERLMGYLLSISNVFSSTMPIDGNAVLLGHEEGKRFIGNEIVALQVRGPEQFKAARLQRLASIAQGEDE